MKYEIKCENCGKKVGEVENPVDSIKTVKGYYCGATSEKGSCAEKWHSTLTAEQQKQFLLEEEIQKKKLLNLLNELNKKKKR